MCAVIEHREYRLCSFYVFWLHSMLIYLTILFMKSVSGGGTYVSLTPFHIHRGSRVGWLARLTTTTTNVCPKDEQVIDPFS